MHVFQDNSYEKLKTFKYLGSLVTNKNSIQEEIKCKLKAGNSCYYSVQTFLSSRLHSKNLKIKIYKTIILSVVLYGPLKEEGWVRVFVNGILRRIFGPDRMRMVSGDGSTMRNFMVCTVHLI